jgi:hypothetical protein
MKIIKYLPILLLTFYACEDDITNEEKKEIFISQNIPIIKNRNIDIENSLDLFFKIKDQDGNYITENIFEVVYEEQNETIEISLSIKDEFSDKFYFSSGGSIFSSIFGNCNSDQELDLIGENQPDYQNMLEVLCDNSDFNFIDSENIVIPITFHLLKDCKLDKFENKEDRIIDRTNKLNNYFSDAKISFTLKGFDDFSVDHFPTSSYNILDQTRADEVDMPYDENSINIYVADLISSSIDCAGERNGVALYPDNEIRTNRIFIETIAFSNLESDDPEGFLLAHELGHTFSLMHTFQSFQIFGVDIPIINCDSNQCLEFNDGICSTPISDYELDFSLPCENPMVKNLMSYSPKTHPQCSNYEFTNEQNRRMRFAAQYWYSDLFETKLFSDFQNIEDVFISDESISSIEFSDDGLNFYYTSGNILYHYELNNPFDFSNGILTEEVNVPNHPKSVQISNDGTILIVHYENGNGDVFREYSLDSPFNVTNMTVTSSKFNWYEIRRQSHLVENSQSFIYSQCDYFSVVSLSLKKLDISNTTINESQFVGGVSTNPICFNSFAFTPEGYEVYGAGNSDNILRKHKLGAPFDLSTLNIDNPIDTYQLKTGERIFYLSSEEEMFFTLRNEEGNFIISKYY